MRSSRLDSILSERRPRIESQQHLSPFLSPVFTPCGHRLGASPLRLAGDISPIPYIRSSPPSMIDWFDKLASSITRAHATYLLLKGLHAATTGGSPNPTSPPPRIDPRNVKAILTETSTHQPDNSISHEDQVREQIIKQRFRAI